jgi:hypothetical protein
LKVIIILYLHQIKFNQKINLCQQFVSSFEETRKTVQFEESGKKSAIFGSNVFNEKTMKQYLTGML